MEIKCNDSIWISYYFFLDDAETADFLLDFFIFGAAVEFFSSIGFGAFETTAGFETIGGSGLISTGFEVYATFFGVSATDLDMGFTGFGIDFTGLLIEDVDFIGVTETFVVAVVGRSSFPRSSAFLMIGLVTLKPQKKHSTPVVLHCSKVNSRGKGAPQHEQCSNIFSGIIIRRLKLIE